MSFSVPVKIDVDAAVAPPMPETEPVQEQSDTITTNILVVEDDNVGAMYLNEILADLNVNYKIAKSFAQMQKICNEGFSPDIALLDISLPDANGFDCRKWLIDRFPGKNITHIAQTAHVLEEDIKRYQEAGFDGFIGKPYGKEEIIKIIERS